MRKLNPAADRWENVGGRCAVHCWTTVDHTLGMALPYNSPHPWVAYVTAHNGVGSSITVKRRTGRQYWWDQTPSPRIGGSVMLSPVLAFAPGTDTAYLTYCENLGGLTVMTLNEDGWELLSPLSRGFTSHIANRGVVSYPAVVISGSGVPHVGFIDTVRADQPSAMRLYDAATPVACVNIGNCTRQNLTSVSSDIAAGIVIEAADLSSNRLVEFTHVGLAHIAGLVRVSLRNNRITLVAPLALISLPQLTYLDLRNNQIERLGAGMLSGQTALRQLLLQGNPLRAVAPGALAGLSKLLILGIAPPAVDPVDRLDGPAGQPDHVGMLTVCPHAPARPAWTEAELVSYPHLENGRENDETGQLGQCVQCTCSESAGVTCPVLQRLVDASSSAIGQQCVEIRAAVLGSSNATATWSSAPRVWALNRTYAVLPNAVDATYPDGSAPGSTIRHEYRMVPNPPGFFMNSATGAILAMPDLPGYSTRPGPGVAVVLTFDGLPVAILSRFEVVYAFADVDPMGNATHADDDTTIGCLNGGVRSDNGSEFDSLYHCDCTGLAVQYQAGDPHCRAHDTHARSGATHVYDNSSLGCLHGGRRIENMNSDGDPLGFDGHFTCDCSGLDPRYWGTPRCDDSIRLTASIESVANAETPPGLAFERYRDPAPSPDGGGNGAADVEPLLTLQRVKWAVGERYRISPLNVTARIRDQHGTLHPGDITARFVVDNMPPGFFMRTDDGELFGEPRDVMGPINSILFATVSGYNDTGVAAISFEFAFKDTDNRSITATGPNGRPCGPDAVKIDSAPDGVAEFDLRYACRCLNGFSGTNCEAPPLPAEASAEVGDDTGVAVGAALGGILFVVLGVLAALRVQVYLLKHRPQDVSAMQRKVMQDLGLAATTNFGQDEFGITLVFDRCPVNAAAELSPLFKRELTAVLAKASPHLKAALQAVQLTSADAKSVRVLAVMPKRALRTRAGGASVGDGKVAQCVESIARQGARGRLFVAGFNIVDANVAVPQRVPREIARSALTRISRLGGGAFGEVHKYRLAEKGRALVSFVVRISTLTLNLIQKKPSKNLSPIISSFQPARSKLHHDSGAVCVGLSVRVRASASHCLPHRPPSPSKAVRPARGRPGLILCGRRRWAPYSCTAMLSPRSGSVPHRGTYLFCCCSRTIRKATLRVTALLPAQTR